MNEALAEVGKALRQVGGEIAKELRLYEITAYLVKLVGKFTKG